MIRRKNTLSTVLAGMAMAATVLVPGVGWGAPPPAHQPLITDPAGDAGLVCRANENVFVAVNSCASTVPQPAKPDVDIVRGDITYAPSDLTFETTVVDLDAGSPRPHDVAFYRMTAVTGNVTITMSAERNAARTSSFGLATVSSTNGRSVSGPVTYVFDDAANTVRWTISLAALNDLILHVCADCRGLRRESTLTGITASTAVRDHSALLGIGYETDQARASRPYTIGAD